METYVSYTVSEIKDQDPSAKKRQVLTLLEPETFDRVRQIAEQEDRPMSAAVRRLVVEALDAREGGAAA